MVKFLWSDNIGPAIERPLNQTKTRALRRRRSYQRREMTDMIGRDEVVGGHEYYM